MIVACSSAPKIATRQELNQHIVRTSKFYEKYRSAKIEDRVYAAPPEFIDYLLKDNAAQGFPNKPESAELTSEIRSDIHSAIAELPTKVRRALDEHVAGIFVVKDLGGSAYTDFISSPDGKSIGGFIVLDISATNRKANEWITWKENTPFKVDPAYSLQALIEGKSRDTRRYAIQFILLHEFAHALSIGKTLHPIWGTNPSEVVPEKFPFFQLSWKAVAPLAPETRWKYGSQYDHQMTERKQLLYYMPLKTTLTGIQMKGLYDKLEKTNFLTLYGATNPFDDFAEAFATYVHIIFLKQPYVIKITKNGKKIKSYRPDWNSPRFREKRKLIEELFI